jgi:hypothetical protein
MLDSLGSALVARQAGRSACWRRLRRSDARVVNRRNRSKSEGTDCEQKRVLTAHLDVLAGAGYSLSRLPSNPHDPRDVARHTPRCAGDAQRVADLARDGSCRYPGSPRALLRDWLNPQQRALILIREDVEISVRPLAHIADALFQVLQQMFPQNQSTVLVEHETFEALIFH